MGKHKDFEYEDFGIKRHHKKKKHKHKHQRPNERKPLTGGGGSLQTAEYDSDQVDVVNDSNTITRQLNTSNTSTSVSPQQSSDKIKTSLQSQKNVLQAKSSSKKKKTKGRDSGTSSDEERWLDAIESGKLEEVDDELKKIKDPKLMTARQRAMYERGNTDKEFCSSELLMSLPTGYREKEKVMTAEAIQKAQLKSLKRKQLADEKREKDKKKTMERLLKKQETKQRTQGRNKQAKVIVPMQTYMNSIEGSVICLPPEHEFPLKTQEAVEVPKPILCAISECNNLKNYNCSKTNVPLCSFACYKKNLELAREIIC